MERRLIQSQVAVTRRIAFVRATKPDVSDQQLRAKLGRPLNAQQKQQQASTTAVGTPPCTKTEDELEVPTCWSSNLAHKGQSVGAGLVNFGNTCFMNATLQCLTHTPPLAQFLLSPVSDSFHPKHPDASTPCLFCILRTHIRSALPSSSSVTSSSHHQQQHLLKPVSIARVLPRVCRTFRPGRQEDAHEALRGLLDGLQRACLGQSLAVRFPPRVTPDREAATLIHRIFGGKLVSSVRCTACGHESRTADPFLDLSLELSGGVNSIEDALKRFAAPERLEGTGYKCDGCKRRTVIEKTLRVAQAPLVLTLHLKRFAFIRRLRQTGKISRDIHYPLRLSNACGTGCCYDLFAVLVHEGATSFSGHYYAFVKAPAGQWYEMDDDAVRQVPVAAALRQQSAYILFYLRNTVVQIPTLLNADTDQVHPTPSTTSKRIIMTTSKDDNEEEPPKSKKRRTIEGPFIWTEIPIAPMKKKERTSMSVGWHRTTAETREWHAPMALPQALAAAEIVPKWEDSTVSPPLQQQQQRRNSMTVADREAAARKAKDDEWDAEYDAPRPTKKRSQKDTRTLADRSEQFDRFLEARKRREEHRRHQ